MVEKDLQLTGITAIEDKLQAGVPATIETLLMAGIKVRPWSGRYLCSRLYMPNRYRFAAFPENRLLRRPIALSSSITLGLHSVETGGFGVLSMSMARPLLRPVLNN